VVLVTLYFHAKISKLESSNFTDLTFLYFVGNTLCTSLSHRIAMHAYQHTCTHTRIAHVHMRACRILTLTCNMFASGVNAQPHTIQVELRVSLLHTEPHIHFVGKTWVSLAKGAAPLSLLVDLMFVQLAGVANILGSIRLPRAFPPPSVSPN
jgi:hypothetical protein